MINLWGKPSYVLSQFFMVLFPKFVNSQEHVNNNLFQELRLINKPFMIIMIALPANTYDVKANVALSHFYCSL